MMDFSPNHHERIFANWLLEHWIPCVWVDESKRMSFGRSDIKSFGFLVEVSDYRQYMKRRSARSQTVTLPAEKFRETAMTSASFYFDTV